MAGIAPTRGAGRVGRARRVLRVDAIRGVLAAAIAAGGSTLRDYARPDGELGYFSKQWRVYGREGEPCVRSEEHTSELQSLMRISYAVFCLKKKKRNITEKQHSRRHT